MTAPTTYSPKASATQTKPGFTKFGLAKNDIIDQHWGSPLKKRELPGPGHYQSLTDFSPVK